MSKYQELYHHLIKTKQAEWTASFTEIETILGFSLPKSAYLYPAWWANQEYSSQCQSWLNAGWVTSALNLLNKQVTFYRATKRPTKPIKTIRKTSTKKVKNSMHEWDEPFNISCELTMQWKPLGKVELDENNRLLFPSVDTVPALYRFRIIQNYKEAFYIGETVNIRRRLGNYKNPGNTQATSLRINKELVNALCKGADISVSMITEDAFINKGDGDIPLDLSSKVARCCLENVAILCGSAKDIDNLNKANI